MLFWKVVEYNLPLKDAFVKKSDIHINITYVFVYDTIH